MSSYSQCTICEIEFKIHPKSTGKYCSYKCANVGRRKACIDKWLETGVIPLKVPAYVRDYLLEKQEELCSICKSPAIWNGRPQVFVADHIDGNSLNNLPSNMRMICRNCESQLLTSKKRNVGRGRYSIRKATSKTNLRR